MQITLTNLWILKSVVVSCASPVLSGLGAPFFYFLFSDVACSWIELGFRSRHTVERHMRHMERKARMVSI